MLKDALKQTRDEIVEKKKLLRVYSRLSAFFTYNDMTAINRNVCKDTFGRIVRLIIINQNIKGTNKGRWWFFHKLSIGENL